MVEKGYREKLERKGRNGLGKKGEGVNGKRGGWKKTGEKCNKRGRPGKGCSRGRWRGIRGNRDANHARGKGKALEERTGGRGGCGVKKQFCVQINVIGGRHSTRTKIIKGKESKGMDQKKGTNTQKKWGGTGDGCIKSDKVGEKTGA